MPKIPLAQFTPSETPAASARADMGMFDSQARANQAMAKTAMALGQGMVDFQLRKQEAVNYAQVAEADLKMKTAFADYTESLKTNGDEKTFIPGWEKRASEVEKELGMDKMAPAVRDRLAPQLKAWKAESFQQVRSVTTARELNRAQATIEEAALFAMNQGDATGATELMRGGEKRGVFTPQQTQDAIARFSNQAVYANYERQLSDITQMTPAMQSEQLAKMEGELTAKDGKSYANGHVSTASGEKVGGLNEPSRNNLIQAARSQKHAVDTGMVRSFAPVLDAYERGGIEAGDAAATNALQAGTVTKQFAQSMESAMRGAYAEGAAKRAKAASADEAEVLREQRRQFSNFEGLRGKLAELTPKRIMEEENLGNVSEAQAAQLRAGLSGTAVVEMGLPELKDARGNPVRAKADPRVLIDNYAKRAIVSGKDASIEERVTMLDSIGQAPVAVATKAKLMRELIELFDVDFRAEDDYQPEQKQSNNPPGVYGIPDAWVTKSGRKIDQWEKKVRGRLYGTLLQSGELGEAWTVNALRQAERDIAAFYSSEEYGKMTPEKRNQFNDDVVKRIADQGGMRVVEGIVRLP